MRRTIRLAALRTFGVALASAVTMMAASMTATPVHAQAPAGGEKAAKNPRQEGLHIEPARTLRFTTNEGSWISVDVSPDGKMLVFDLLGDIY